MRRRPNEFDEFDAELLKGMLPGVLIFQKELIEFSVRGIRDRRFVVLVVADGIKIVVIVNCEDVLHLGEARKSPKGLGPDAKPGPHRVGL